MSATEPAVTPELRRRPRASSLMNIERILKLIGRRPSFTELGVFSAMWNEHCSYKSSRIHLRKLPTKAPWVIQVRAKTPASSTLATATPSSSRWRATTTPRSSSPIRARRRGWAASARRVHDGRAADRLPEPVCASAIRTIQDAPAGRRSSRRRRRLWQQFRRADRRRFDANSTTSYDGNILVNAMGGRAWPAPNSIFYSAAAGVGNPIVYLGSKTGRDGIHGATMASAVLRGRRRGKTSDRAGRRSFLREAAARGLSRADRVRARSSPFRTWAPPALPPPPVEMAQKGDLGIELDLDAVPCREAGMSAYEMMLSENRSACSWF